MYRNLCSKKWYFFLKKFVTTIRSDYWWNKVTINPLSQHLILPKGGVISDVG